MPQEKSLQILGDFFLPVSFCRHVSLTTLFDHKRKSAPIPERLSLVRTTPVVREAGHAIGPRPLDTFFIQIQVFERARQCSGVSDSPPQNLVA